MAAAEVDTPTATSAEFHLLAHRRHIMLNLLDLWLPILASAAAVWFWAFLSWAILPVHKRDFGPLPDEDAFVRAMRELNLRPGQFAFPFCKDNAQRNDPAFTEKWKTGPSGLLNVWKPNPNM